MNLIGSTKTWLQSNGILVPEDWLQACVEWIQEEHQGSSPGQSQINDMVYEQWLLADLHELETQCLPADLINSPKYQLHGNYALQIDSVLDVGKSFYSQLQKVKGTENANVHVTAEEPTQKPWEAKPSRMLMLKLTDGTQSVQGMEYRPLNSLNVNTAPGTKVLVHGEVLCRRAILMLTENNVKFLGGEVDTLTEANKQTQVLQSALDSSGDTPGRELRQEFQGSEIRHSKCQNNKTASVTTARGGNSFGMSQRGDNFTQFKKEPLSQVAPSQAVQSGKGRQAPGPDRKVFSNNNVPTPVSNQDDQWDDDQNYAAYYDAFMEDMDDMDEFSEPRQSAAPAVVQQNPSESHRDNRGQLSTGHGATGDMAQSQRRLTSVSDTRNQNASSRLSANRPLKVPAINTNQTLSKQNSSNIRITPRSGVNPGPRNSSVTSKGQAQIARADDDFELDDFEFDDDFDCPDVDTSKFHQNLAKSTAQPSLLGRQGVKRDYHGNASATSQSSSTLGRNAGNSSSKQSRPTPTNPPPANHHYSDLTININVRDGYSEITMHPNAGPNNTAQGQQWQPSTGLKSTTGASASKLARTTDSSQCGDKSQKPGVSTGHSVTKPQTSNTGLSSLKGTESVSNYPFTYLRHALEQNVCLQPRIFTVKAYISTLTSKLTVVNNCWSLTVKINDGTAAVEADLSSEVLNKLIGFPAKDTQVMKQQAKKDKAVRDKLTGGIQQCQKRLIELLCLMELEISSAHSRPQIVAICPVTQNHVDLLYNRVISLMNK